MLLIFIDNPYQYMSFTDILKHVVEYNNHLQTPPLRDPWAIGIDTRESILESVLRYISPSLITHE